MTHTPTYQEICECGHIQGIHDFGSGPCAYWKPKIGNACHCEEFKSKAIALAEGKS